jgi:hypothetical protein
MKWEHAMTMVLEDKERDSLQHLQYFSYHQYPGACDNTWELVTVVRTSDGYLRYYWKRPVNSDV